MPRTRFSYWPVLFLALLGCRKDEQVFQPYAPSVQEISNLLAQQVPSASTHSIFTLTNLATDKVLETPSGAQVFLVDTDHLFMNPQTSQPVLCSTCPDLKVEVIEVLDKRDILSRGLHTIGDSGMLFESGGMVRITVSCNGQQLSLLPDATLKVQLPNNSTQSGFFVFSQGTSTLDKWTKSNQEVFQAEWLKLNGTLQTGYEILVKNLGWAACGRIMSDPTSSFCVELPSGFADQNTLAHIVFKNQQIVAPLQYNLGNNKFCFPKAPQGFQIQLLAVSKLGDQYWLGKAQTEIGANSATFQLGTQEMTEEAVLNFVKGL